ncbi:MAG: 4Fe-4S binding protein [Lachnospiraceae bacterium]|nr:4Fe-4S binding protein [Lachnospiraceae bacterium]
MTKKQMRQRHNLTRRIIQLVFFLFYPSLFTAAFTGVKYIFTQLGAGNALALTSFVSVLLTLCIYTIVFGRFFCGYACAFGSFGDLIHGIYLTICKKLKKKPKKISAIASRRLSVIKYLLLAVILGACFFGTYGTFQYSPWDVFSMLTALKPRVQGYIIGWILLLLIMIGMAVKERFFCRFLCPMGAVFSLLPVLPLFSLHRDRDNCRKGCRACTSCCPSEVELPARGAVEVSGDCFQCGKCTDTCPGGNVHTGIHIIKGNEIWFTILRAAILIIICLVLNL